MRPGRFDARKVDVLGKRNRMTEPHHAATRKPARGLAERMITAAHEPTGAHRNVELLPSNAVELEREKNLMRPLLTRDLRRPTPTESVSQRTSNTRHGAIENRVLSHSRTSFPLAANVRGLRKSKPRAAEHLRIRARNPDGETKALMRNASIRRALASPGHGPGVLLRVERKPLLQSASMGRFGASAAEAANR